MAPIKFLLALSSLAILCTLGASPANALSVDVHHVNRHVNHHGIAKKRRDGSTANCKPRTPPASTPKPSSNSPNASPANKPKSSSSASTPPPSTPTYTPASDTSTGGAKLLIAWALGNDPRLKLLKNDRTKFVYTWSPDEPEDAQSLGFTFVPQLWGYSQIGDFTNKVKAGFANHVLGMNEPNQAGQAQMSPQDGANLWMQYIQPLKNEGYQLITPATTSDPDGMTWMHDFMAACHGCTFDKVAIHWYDTTFEKFQTYLELWHNTFNLPIWVTEFACQNFNGGAQPDSGQIWEFYTQSIEWLDSTDWVELYAPFGFMDGMSNVNPADSLFSGDGLSSLGWLVLNGPSS